MTEIVWEEPPKQARGRRYDHHAIADALRAKPGEWAKIAAAVSPQMANHIANGHWEAYMPAGSFDAVTRNRRLVDGRLTPVADVYVRYIGDGST